MIEFELIVPAYNEAASLPELARRTAEAAGRAGLSPSTFQLVLVDNGSTDETPRVLTELRATPLGAWFRVVRVERNQGYGHGLFTGLQASTAPCVGWSHADLQSDPGDAFIARSLVLAGGNKVLAKGARTGRLRRDRLVSGVFALCARVILNARLPEINAQPKVFHRSLLAALPHPPKDFAFDLYVLYSALKQGMKLATFPVHFPPRVHGASKWASTFLSRWKTIARMILYMFRLALTEGRLPG